LSPLFTTVRIETSHENCHRLIRASCLKLVVCTKFAFTFAALNMSVTAPMFSLSMQAIRLSWASVSLIFLSSSEAKSHTVRLTKVCGEISLKMNCEAYSLLILSIKLRALDEYKDGVIDVYRHCSSSAAICLKSYM